MASNRALVPQQTALTWAQTIVPYLTPEEVTRLAAAAGQNRHGERDALLVRVLFETGLRISEALQITPKHLELFEGRPACGSWARARSPGSWPVRRP